MSILPTPPGFEPGFKAGGGRPRPMSERGTDAVSVTIWSDYVCPYCHIGLANLDRAMAAMGEDAPTAIDWQPFELRPETPEEGWTLQDVFGVEETAIKRAQAERLAASQGVAMNLPDRVPNTRLAHALAQVAKSIPDVFAAFHPAVFTAHWEEGRDIGDPATLRELWKAAGGEDDLFDEVLEHHRDLDATSAARRIGITGVPTFLMQGPAGIVPLVGAHPVEDLDWAVKAARGDEEGALSLQ